jgi:hypothetical protein
MLARIQPSNIKEATFAPAATSTRTEIASKASQR